MSMKVHEVYRIPNKLDEKRKSQMLAQIPSYHIMPGRKNSSTVTVYIFLSHKAKKFHRLHQNIQDIFVTDIGFCSSQPCKDPVSKTRLFNKTWRN